MQRSDERGAVKPDRIVDRLSLMQHHGVPTRLLDFSRSPYIATYFALWRKLGKKKCAVWAINKWWLRYVEIALISKWVESRAPYEMVDRKRIERIIDRYFEIEHKEERHEILHELFSSYYDDYNSPQGIIRLIPDNLHARLMAQQSLFLAPLSIKGGFMENLVQCYNLTHDSFCEDENELPHVIKFVIPEEHHLEIAQDLTMMNVTGFSLMPDMEGLSEWINFTKLLKSQTLVSQNKDKQAPGKQLHPRISKQSATIGPIEFSDFRVEFFVPNMPGSFCEVLGVLLRYHINLEFYYLVEMHEKIHRPSLDCKIPEGLFFDDSGGVSLNVTSDAGNVMEETQLVKPNEVKLVLRKIQEIEQQELRLWFSCKQEFELVKKSIGDKEIGTEIGSYSATMTTLLVFAMREELYKFKLLCAKDNESCKKRENCTGPCSREDAAPPIVLNRRHHEIGFSGENKRYRHLCDTCSIPYKDKEKYITSECHWKIETRV